MKDIIYYSKLSITDIEQAKRIITEYIQSMNIDFSFQDIDGELLSFPDKYKEPEGTFIIAKQGDDICGCVGLTKIDHETCEMKRLFVRDAFKGLGIGKELLLRILQEGTVKGYKTMRLHTHRQMKKALEIYRFVGFYEIEPYTYNPVEGTVYMERDCNTSFPPIPK